MALNKFRSAMALIAWITAPAGLEVPNLPRLAAQTPAAQAHFTFPDTPAARQLEAWLAAFDSGDRATIQAFVTKSMPEGTGPDFADQTIEMRSQFGGLDFQKIEQSTDVRFVGVAKTRSGGGTHPDDCGGGFGRAAPDHLRFPPARFPAPEHPASSRNEPK